MYALTNPLTPTAAPDCASEEGLCRLVYRTTRVDWVAESSDWLIAKPAIVLGIVVGALIVRWIAHRFITRLVRSTGETTVPIVLRPFRERTAESLASAALVSERRRQRAETIGSVLRSIASAAIFVIAAMTILGELGINLAPLIASAGIAGVALGFGAQSLVKDFLSGMFMILEDQYGVGDIVDLGEANGTVEGVGLRCTTVRDVNGVVWYVRNGEVIRVGNRTQGWAQVVIDVPLPYGTKLDEAQELITKVVQEFAGDEEFADALLEPPEVLGVEQITITGMFMRVIAKTTTADQFRVARQLRRRISDALEEAGISQHMAASQLMMRTMGAQTGIAGGAGATGTGSGSGGSGSPGGGR